MNETYLVTAMFCHVSWVALLYVLLTVVRAPAIWGVDTPTGALHRWAYLEPRISRNLANQFEWPVLFYAVAILLLWQARVDAVAGILTWLFIAGRMIHSVVQIFTANVRLRGAVFTVNFLAVWALWLYFLDGYFSR